MSPGSCCRPSTISRRNTSCGWSLPMSVAVSAPRSHAAFEIRTGVDREIDDFPTVIFFFLSRSPSSASVMFGCSATNCLTRSSCTANVKSCSRRIWPGRRCPSPSIECRHLLLLSLFRRRLRRKWLDPRLQMPDWRATRHCGHGVLDLLRVDSGAARNCKRPQKDCDDKSRAHGLLRRVECKVRFNWLTHVPVAIVVPRYRRAGAGFH
jgi:hypothetical protein